MKCLICGREIPDSAKICGYCGTPCGAAPSNAVFCQNCGTELFESDKFCPSCGSPIVGENGSNTGFDAGYNQFNDNGNMMNNQQYFDSYNQNMNYMPPKPQKKSRLGIIILVIVLALGLGVGAFYVASHYFFNDPDEQTEAAVKDNNADKDKSDKKKTRTKDKKNSKAADDDEKKDSKSSIKNKSAKADEDKDEDERADKKDSSASLLPTNSEYISSSQLDRYTRDEVRLMLNEMYARHGYIFQTDYYKNYFNSQSWYNGTTTSQEVAQSRFNEYEESNRKTIMDYESKHGWR